jgi:NIMA (never in mitosis gene a)-related kinase
MLVKDPRRRPSVNDVLRMPIIEKRINMFLGDAGFKDEFSHTLLHNQDVFREF